VDDVTLRLDADGSDEGDGEGGDEGGEAVHGRGARKRCDSMERDE
jgi:hypothetical protein